MRRAGRSLRDEEPSIESESLVRLGVGLAALVVIAQSAAHLVNFSFLEERFSALDANTNGGIFDWVGAIALAGAVGSALLLAVRASEGGRVWLAMSTALLALLLVDDIFQLHRGLGTYWQELYVPIVAPVFVVLWLLAGTSPPPACRSVRFGLVLLAVSLLAGQAAEPVLTQGGWGVGTSPYELKVVFKQGAELAGWTLLAVGLAACVTAERKPRIRGGLTETPPRRPAAGRV